MGAYVSVSECKSQYNVTINCTVEYEDNSNETIKFLGTLEKGEFEGDADIGGIGIYGTFIAVTSFALTLSLIVVLLGMVKHRIFPFQACDDGCILTPRTSREKPRIKPGISEILQAMVLSCSDAQIFTGAAYALALRYFRGCDITVYHYNIVSNLMLLTCATHLMAITVVRNYWEHAWLAVLRVACKTGVFLVTGLLLSNQNAHVDVPFPTYIPPKDDTVTPLFLAAACFQSNSSGLFTNTLGTSLSSGGREAAFMRSSPGNQIEGWSKYLIILLWFIVAVVMEFAMFIRRGNRRNGWRKRIISFFWSLVAGISRPSSTPGELGTGTSLPETEEPDQKRVRRLKLFGHYLLTVYYLGGVGICIWTVADAGRYVGGLRQWVQDSQWLKLNQYGLNPENDATSFGQLVPIFTSGLVLFTFLEMLSTAVSRRRDAKAFNDLQTRFDEEKSRSDLPSSSLKIQYISEAVPVTNSTDSIPPRQSDDRISPVVEQGQGTSKVDLGPSLEESSGVQQQSRGSPRNSR